MIRTLSTNATNTSCSSNEQQTSLSSRPRRFTLHALATRLSDSKKTLLEQIPNHQHHLTRFKKRARSLLASALIDQSKDIKSSSSNERNSTPGVHK